MSRLGRRCPVATKSSQFKFKSKVKVEVTLKTKFIKKLAICEKWCLTRVCDANVTWDIMQVMPASHKKGHIMNTKIWLNRTKLSSSNGLGSMVLWALLELFNVGLVGAATEVASISWDAVLTINKELGTRTDGLLVAYSHHSPFSLILSLITFDNCLLTCNKSRTGPTYWMASVHPTLSLDPPENTKTNYHNTSFR